MSKTTISAKLKRLVRKRARNVCEYCLAISTYAFHPFCIDHIVPISEGGADGENNLAFSCQHCNSCKYNKRQAIDPLTGQDTLLYNPRKEEWGAHFIWNEDHSIIIGITSVGRASVASLKMNRKEAINLRKALAAFGVHPPD